MIVVSGKVKYTDSTNGNEVLIAGGEKYSGGRELKAAEDEQAAAAAASAAFSSPGFSIKVPLRQGVFKTEAIAPAEWFNPIAIDNLKPVSPVEGN